MHKTKALISKSKHPFRSSLNRTKIPGINVPNYKLQKETFLGDFPQKISKNKLSTAELPAEGLSLWFCSASCNF